MGSGRAKNRGNSHLHNFRRSAALLIGTLALTTGVASSCAGTDGPLSVRVVHAAALDGTAHIDVIGLRPRASATLTIRATDAIGQKWFSRQRIHGQGHTPLHVPLARVIRVLHTSRPSPTTYFVPASQFSLSITVSAPSQRAVQRSVTVHLRTPTTRVTQLTALRDGVSGRLYRPTTASKRIAIVVIGGSDGLEPDFVAELLASHGYTSLALSYFGLPGLPRQLKSIPLEYFIRTVKKCAVTIGLPADRIVLFGTSRGAEAALLTAASYPSLVRAGVIAYVPPPSVYGALAGGAAWTLNGHPLAAGGRIPLGRIRAPVVAFGAGRDAVWASALAAGDVGGRGSKGITFAQAGHGIGSIIPNLPGATAARFGAVVEPFGGTRSADIRARSVAWKTTLRFLASAAAQ